MLPRGFRLRLGGAAASGQSPGDAADGSTGGAIRSSRPAGGAKGPQLQKLLQAAVLRWRWFQAPGKEKSKGTGRKRGGQEGHPGASRNLWPVE